VDTHRRGIPQPPAKDSTVFKKVYPEEFKQSAVNMVVVQRNTMKSVSKRLDVNYHTLREWVQAAKSNATESLVSKELPLEQQMRELVNENARLRTGRDILKKVAAYFTKEHL